MKLVEYLMMHEDKIINLHFPAKTIYGAKCSELLMEGEYLSMYKILKIDESLDSTDVYVK